jgi:serine/threonine protein phosphatase 1
MSLIYAISDIHGCLQPLLEALSLVDLESDKENKLIFCGDYIDYGPNSCEVLYKVKELYDNYPHQVIVLMGNHEYMFLEFLNAKDKDIWNVEWLGADKGFSTVNTFISESCKYKIEQLNSELGQHAYLNRVAKAIKGDILINHKDLIKWLKGLNYYYETEFQIFVHAGVDEEAEEYWMYGTSDENFVSKFPAAFGKFYKDIIAGHVSVSSLAEDKNYHSVYWDGFSHYYIDGTVYVTGNLLLLKYDTVLRKYSCFNKEKKEHIVIKP